MSRFHSSYHVIAGRIFSSDPVEGLTPATVDGSTVTITLNCGANVNGRKNAGVSTISDANLAASIGIIHVIDLLLLP